MNHTSNYNLNQWEPDDKIQRTDFNADNVKIDAALGTLAARLSTRGNCRVVTGQYTGTGTFGEGNANAAVGENKFFTIAGGLLVPTAAAPTKAGTVYFALRGTGNFTEGTRGSFGYIDVVACKVIAGATTGG